LFHEISLYKTIDNVIVWEKPFKVHTDVIIENLSFGIIKFAILENEQICVAGKSLSVISLPTESFSVEYPVVFFV
jgi:hypothetical protein